MGDWTITIIGTGAHHNAKPAGRYEPEEAAKFDANELAKSFVDQLVASGQTIRHASFVYGGSEVFSPGEH